MGEVSEARAQQQLAPKLKCAHLEIIHKWDGDFVGEYPCTAETRRARS